MQNIKNSFKVTIKKTMNLQNSKLLFVNEAVNTDKEVIFIAIPKTGTTTVRTQLRQKGTPLIENPHLNILQIRDLIYFQLLKENLGKDRTFPHLDKPDDTELRRMASEIFDSFFKFSAVRNPWSRAVSLFFRREGKPLGERMSFDEFCEDHCYASDTCKQPTRHKNQYDWICDENGKIILDYVYKVEEFENAINVIKDRTNGGLILKNIKLNNNPKSKSSDYRNLYNDKTRKLIEKRFEKDIDYFKYTF